MHSTCTRSPLVAHNIITETGGRTHNVNQICGTLKMNCCRYPTSWRLCDWYLSTFTSWSPFFFPNASHSYTAQCLRAIPWHAPHFQWYSNMYTAIYVERLCILLLELIMVEHMHVSGLVDPNLRYAVVSNIKWRNSNCRARCINPTTYVRVCKRPLLFFFLP